jgi:hypothetical protein
MNRQVARSPLFIPTRFPQIHSRPKMFAASMPPIRVPAKITHRCTPRIVGLDGNTSMTEEEFDSWLPGRPFQRQDLTQAEADASRFTMLGVALWGKTRADLERRLDAPRPEIPHGCTLEELRRMQDYLRRLSAAASKTQNAWLTPLTLCSAGLLAGSPKFTELEGRLEVVRRAIEYLENQ